MVELSALTVPEWARKKAIRGLTITDTKVWLGRIAANFLARLDREAGGVSRITLSEYRRCGICDRPLLGVEAVERFEQDRRFAGEFTKCGPDCVQRDRRRRAA